MKMCRKCFSPYALFIYCFCFISLHSQAQTNTPTTTTTDSANNFSKFAADYLGAFSLRTINPAYTGPLLRIQIEGLFYDVFADATGTITYNSKVSKAFAISSAPTGKPSPLNLQSVLSGMATIAIWYDQSGKANNATQPIADKRPIIIKASAINKINDRPAILLTGKQFLQMPCNMINNGITINTVFLTSTTNPTVLWSNKNKQLSDTSLGLIFSVSCSQCITNTPALFAESAHIKIGMQANAELPKTFTNIVTAVVNAFNPQKPLSPNLFSLYINGENFGSSPTINSTPTNTPANLSWEPTAFIGFAPFYNIFATGNLFEVIVINKALTNSERLPIETEQAAYYLPNTNFKYY